MIKLWHDDIRRPPDESWSIWVRNNDAAKGVLNTGMVDVISMDHDLGLHDVNPDTPNSVYLRGQGEQTGLDLVDWMCQDPGRRIPAIVIIHSWNPVGAERMAKTLRRYECKVIVQPFQVPNDRTVA